MGSPKNSSRSETLKLTITTTLAVLATVLFTTTACAGESVPAPTTEAPTANADPGETGRLASQVQELQDENAAIREELATLTSASQEQPQRQQAPTMETPIKPNLKPDRSIHNICERSPSAQKAILSTLKLNRCSSVDGQELFRIEAIGVGDNLKAGDLNGLVNLKTLNLSAKEPMPASLLEELTNLETLNLGFDEQPPPTGILNGLTKLETLSISISPDNTWDLEGILTGGSKLKTITINAENVHSLRNNVAPSKVNIQEGDLDGLQELEEIAIIGAESINGDPFAGLESLNYVALRSASPSGSEPSTHPAFPQDAFLNNPNVKRWHIERFSLAEEMPMASLEQFCKMERKFGGTPDPKHSVNGEPVYLVREDYGVCYVGVGEPEATNGGYSESQIKIVDGRPEATQ